MKYCNYSVKTGTVSSIFYGHVVKINFYQLGGRLSGYFLQKYDGEDIRHKSIANKNFWSKLAKKSQNAVNNGIRKTFCKFKIK